MNSTGTRVTLLLVSTVAALTLTSCVCIGEKVELVDLRTESKAVDLGDAERVVVDVEIGVGGLVVRSGAESLMEAEFTYNVEEWRPAVDYEVVGGTGRLTITQPDAEGTSAPNRAKNEWELHLAEGVPLELNIDMGVGEARLELGDLTLTDLSVDHGVGDVSVNLSGAGIRDMVGSIDGGIGKVSLVVPTDIGVRVDADTGIGSCRTIGLTKRGDSLVNAAYDRSEATIRLSVDSGIGEVVVETADRAGSM